MQFGNDRECTECTECTNCTNCTECTWSQWFNGLNASDSTILLVAAKVSELGDDALAGTRCCQLYASLSCAFCTVARQLQNQWHSVATMPAIPSPWWPAAEVELCIWSPEGNIWQKYSHVTRVTCCLNHSRANSCKFSMLLRNIYLGDTFCAKLENNPGHPGQCENSGPCAMLPGRVVKLLWCKYSVCSSLHLAPKQHTAKAAQQYSGLTGMTVLRCNGSRDVNRWWYYRYMMVNLSFCARAREWHCPSSTGISSMKLSPDNHNPQPKLKTKSSIFADLILRLHSGWQAHCFFNCVCMANPCSQWI